ncbi:hypothetical protein LWE61_08210 [Sphingobium sufflavum]|uniref:hypothetical protein n=1 Tax=Sphingobium sufflavum TaxID=1129547 RepID=UPI001F381B3E|nr:hypothetical protein [Sphingobium sufflavum]MCE7796545.1 hypothetical protein [Sphingobium sufflavum]
MLDLPFNPANLGDTPLARYLAADHRRVPVLRRITELLDDDGRIGDRCRFYVVRNFFRRAILRGVLLTLNINLPSWLFENPKASADNKRFVYAYRHDQRQAA